MSHDPLETCVISRLVEAQAARHAERVAFVVDHHDLPAEEVRFGDLAVRGNQLAHELRRAGLGAGDRVAVMLRNGPEFVYAYAAHSQLGIETVPIDPRSRGEKLRYFLDFAECQGLITGDEVVADEAVAADIRAAGLPAWVASTPEGRARGLDPARDWPVLDEIFAGPERPHAGQHVEDLTRPWLLAYTSGTTGNPKAILFTYNRLLLYRRLPAFFGYRDDDVPYTGLSLTHGNAIIATLLPALWGVVHRSVFSPGFTKSRLWDVCARHGVTTWSNLGGIATAVYSEPPKRADRAHSVRLVVSAGMPREVWEPFEERFGVRILEWYGTMEGGFAYKPVGVGPIGSFGKPPPELLEADVVDDEDRPVGPGQPGELLLRPAGGPAVMEYYKNPEASARKVRGGWLHTGDVVRRDEDGWLFFLHRKEEGGLRKLGEFIAEGFIRRVIAEYPGVADVHIYGVPSRAGAPGETDIVAAVVLTDAGDFAVEALIGHCWDRLERSHVPDLVQVVDELPKTASEKVQTRFLVEALGAPGAVVIETSGVDLRDRLERVSRHA
jgi:acyl-CoA synthetase (AMP-forming)/AMP-acid ligase II